MNRSCGETENALEFPLVCTGFYGIRHQAASRNFYFEHGIFMVEGCGAKFTIK